jgi:aspartate/methionine/tyrosine aminotransferase
VANSPHNPSGFVLGGFAGVAAAVGPGVRVFCDEVYRGLGETPTPGLGCDESELACSLGVLSKSYGLPGLRLGWIVTRDEALLARCRSLHDYTTICTAAPSEVLAVAALARSEALLARTAAIRERNLDVLDAFFARHADLFAWRRPAGGSVAFVRLRSPAERAAAQASQWPASVDALCDAARERGGVLLLPGSAMGEAALPDRFRIGFGRENMPAAVAELERVILEGKKEG